MRRPPGPAGLPILGNLLDYERDRLGFLLRCAREYGPLVRYSDEAYVVNEPELIGEVLNATNRQYRLFADFVGEPIDPASVERWMRARQAAIPGLSRRALELHTDMIVRTTVAHTDTWRPGAPIDPLDALEPITAEIVARFCLGDDGLGISTRAAALIQAVLPIVSNPLGVPTWVPLPRNLVLRRAVRRLRGEIARAVAAPPPGGAAVDLRTLLLDPASRAPLEPALAVQLIMGIVLAGRGIPAAASAWIWWLLDKRPAQRERLEQELDAVIGDRLPTASDLAHLTFTTAVVKEALRVYPPTWLLTRDVVERCELGGYPLRPGQHLVISPYVVGRDPRYFSEPHEFVPERWLDAEWVRALPKFAYVPFGGGNRLCLGYALAMNELVVTTAVIASRMRLRVPASRPVRMDCSGPLVPAGMVVIPEPRRPARPRRAAA